MKDKRRILRSLLQRSRQRFQVAAAEIGLHDSHRQALLAFAYVSNEGRHVDSVLQAVVNWLDKDYSAYIEEVLFEHR